MELILEVAVGAVAVVVTVSLGLLAWTFGVSLVLAARRARAEVAANRARLAAQERRLIEVGERARETLRVFADRTRPSNGDELGTD